MNKKKSHGMRLQNPKEVDPKPNSIHTISSITQIIALPGSRNITVAK